MDEMMTVRETIDKYKLIDGIIHDLSDEQAGLTVRGYRNCNILRTLTEALLALKKGLQDEDNARMQETQMLRKQLEQTHTIDLEGGAAHEDHD